MRKFMKAMFWSLAALGLFGCKSSNKEENLSDEESIARTNGNRYSMLRGNLKTQKK